MRFQHMTCVIVLTLGISVGLVPNASAQTRLGIFFTQEEVQIWKKRAEKGPYKTAGDAGINSPGDWERITKNAGSFLANQKVSRWKGNTLGSCFPQTERQNLPIMRQGRELRDAAFVYLIMGNTAYKEAVLNELLAQAAEPGTKWTDTRLWSEQQCEDALDGSHSPVLMIHAWLKQLLMGYDFIRNDITQSQRNTLDRWFLDAALRFEKNMNKGPAKRWPKRDSEDYSSSLYSTTPYAKLHYNGPDWSWWHGAWNNQFTLGTTYYGLVGIMLDNNYLKARAKRFFKEVIRYNVWADGMLGDTHRWNDNGYPCKGFWYAGDQLSDLIFLADAFARIGDFELYKYTTSEGFAGTEGGPKSLRTVIEYYQAIVDHTIVKYATSNSSQASDSRYIIDSDCRGFPGSNWVGVEDISVAMANRFYRDVNMKKGYMRTGPGDPPYPANPNSTGSCGTSWEGTWCGLPGVLFMFGQMEELVWPYPGSNVEPQPSRNRAFSPPVLSSKP